MTTNNFTHIKHHDTEFWVRKDLVNRSKEFCLCYSCTSYKPHREQSCPIQSMLQNFSKEHHLAAPVFECPSFVRDETFK